MKSQISWIEKDIIDFLYFGYLPSLSEIDNDIFHELQKDNYGDEYFDADSTKKITDSGKRELNYIFDCALDSINSNSNHIIPISGGLDSRAILGGLLERVDSRKIQTITFGTPGTWDFEIGKRVAEFAGVKHLSLDLTKPGWKWEEIGLIETAKRMDQPIQLFDTYVNHKIPEIFGEDCIYWSGFLGGTMTLPQIGSQSWQIAKELFVKEKKFVKSLKITPSFYNSMESLPMQPLCDPETLSFDDQLHLLRQKSLTFNILSRKDYRFLTPFYNKNWISFFSKMPKKFRSGQRAYTEILKTAYPRLFSLPVKKNFGYSLKMPVFLTYPKRALLKFKRIKNSKLPKLYWMNDPNINYIDFNEGLREREDLREIIENNLQDLSERDLVHWIDIENIWDLHKRRVANYADALIILTALEIYMKVEENGKL